MLTFNIEFGTLRDKWISAYSGKSVFNRKGNQTKFDSERSEWKNDPEFYGGGGDDMYRHLTEGYGIEGLDIDPSTIPIRKKKRAKFNDCEGDFRYELYTAGDENCFVEWTKRESIPGITVEFSTGFAGGMSATVITAYMGWVCRALIGLETSGIDCGVYAVNNGTGRFKGNQDELKYRVQVKAEGERTDYIQWSALFSPGAYRILGFFTFMLAADFHEDTVSNHFGYPKSDGWGVKFDKESRILKFTHSHYAKEFDEQKMNTELTVALNEAKGE